MKTMKLKKKGMTLTIIINKKAVAAERMDGNQFTKCWGVAQDLVSTFKGNPFSIVLISKKSTQPSMIFTTHATLYSLTINHPSPPKY